jgi:hypothetical protein
MGGLMVKVEPHKKNNETYNDFIMTDGRFLIKNHAGLFKILEKFNIDLKYLTDRHEIVKKEKYTGIKINDKKNPQNVEGMTFPDYIQVIPSDDKDRIKVNITDLIIDSETMPKRVLIAEDGTVLTMSNIYWELFTEVMDINLNACDITIPAGKSTSAIVFNFDKKHKTIKQSEEFILMMPVRDGITDEMIDQLKTIYKTKTEEPTEPVEPTEPEPVEPTEPEPVEEELQEDPPDDINPAAEVEEPVQEPEAEEEPVLTVSPEEAQELFAKIKASKPYKSFDYSSKLIDILLNNDLDEVKELNKDNRDYPATYKQTRALYRIIFGKHYNHTVYDALMNEIN